MARLPLSSRRKIATTCALILRQMMIMTLEIMVDVIHLLITLNIEIPKPLTYVFDDSLEERCYARILNLRPMIQGSDVACLDNLRMDRACFFKLCEMLKDVGKLQGNRNTSLEEMVALFLYIVSHDTKNRRVQLHFRRSGETISRHFNTVLYALLRCHHILLKNPSYAKLEALLEKKLPGCGKKAKPHIESRVKLLRKQYEAISEMLSPSASGFGWNDESKFVTCPESVWVDWLKSHPNAKGLRNKSFPFYDELGRVFGKDRAVGNEAENVYDALEQMEGVRVAEEQEVLETNVEQVLSQSNAANTPTSTDSTPTSTIPSARRTKKARTETLEAFKDLSSNLGKMTEAIESATNHIGRLASCFQHESDSADRRMKVMSEVMKIEQLTPGEVILVSRKIALNPLEVDFFFSMPQDYRYTYVQGLLIPDL